MKAVNCTNNDITFAIGRERYTQELDIRSVRSKEGYDNLLDSLDGDYIVCSGHEAFEIAQTILNDFRYYALEEDKEENPEPLPF